MIPFLVADRPISLSIIKGVRLEPGEKIGILTHAFTTESFRDVFAKYPAATVVVHGTDVDDSAVEEATVRFVDSGIFSVEGRDIGYEALFGRYESMRAHYGAIVDVFGDPEATVAQARAAWDTYHSKERSFEIVAVAQGKTLDEYLACYESLHAIGFRHIAVGGLLKRRANTARFIHVRCMDLVESVLDGIQSRFRPDWLFPFGLFHPKRAANLANLGVTGADYKGWIFNYVKKEEALVVAGFENNPKADQFDAGMTADVIAMMSEQELRFRCVRNFVRQRVLDPLASLPTRDGGNPEETADPVLLGA